MCVVILTFPFILTYSNTYLEVTGSLDSSERSTLRGRSGGKAGSCTHNDKVCL